MVLKGAVVLAAVDVVELIGKEDQWLQPWSAGGFGWQAVGHDAEAHFLLPSWCFELGIVATNLGHSSASAFLHSVPALNGTLVEAHPRLSEKGACVRDLNEAFQFAGTDSREPKTTAKMYRKQVVARSMTQFQRGAACEHIIAIKASGGPSAGAWLALPSLPQHHVTNQEYATSVRSRAGCDVFHNLGVCKHHAKDRHTGRPTPCTVLCDAGCDHARLCRLGG